jgi:hypothetical protein
VGIIVPEQSAELAVLVVESMNDKIGMILNLDANTV